MGRGRQKAKQRKVARNLKYFTPETDYKALYLQLEQYYWGNLFRYVSDGDKQILRLCNTTVVLLSLVAQCKLLFNPRNP